MGKEGRKEGRKEEGKEGRKEGGREGGREGRKEEEIQGVSGGTQEISVTIVESYKYMIFLGISCSTFPAPPQRVSKWYQELKHFYAKWLLLNLSPLK
jgi:hypothetical protein